jgi:gas vesicle protein GvpO
MAEQSRGRARSSAGARSSVAARTGPGEAARVACERLEGLIARPAEGASSVERVEEGWSVAVDVLEVARIPDTTSLLASYEVRLDQDGELTGYRRVRRYRRGSVGD